MGTYTPVQIEAADGLDEIGLRFSMARLQGETLANFRRRLILESRSRSGPSEREFIQSINSRVAEFEVPVFDITLDLDSNDEPLAPDPFLEVTSTHIRAYSDQANGTIDVEVDFTDRSNGLWLRDIKTAFDASSFFSIAVLDTDYTYKRSMQLRFGDSARYVGRQVLLQRFVNDLGKTSKNLTSFRVDDTTVFAVEQDTVAAVTEDGDYYVDYLNGTVFTYTLQAGIASYAYQEFPYRLYWAAVRAYPYNDDDLKHLHKDDLISDETGAAAPSMLNSLGARIANTVLAAHPIEWGE